LAESSVPRAARMTRALSRRIMMGSSIGYATSQGRKGVGVSAVYVYT
jgi:hypothetical protein